MCQGMADQVPNGAKQGQEQEEGARPCRRAELESLPETMPPCVYLPITQRTSAVQQDPRSLARMVIPQSLQIPLRPRHRRLFQPWTALPCLQPPRSASVLKKTVTNTFFRCSRRLPQLKSQLAQVTGVFTDAQNALSVHQQGGDRSGRHPSKDELAIAHMLATSMPSGEGPSNGSENPLPGSFDYQQAVAAVAANGLGDGANFDVLDPALSGAHSSLPTRPILKPTLQTLAPTLEALCTSRRRSPPSRMAWTRTTTPTLA